MKTLAKDCKCIECGRKAVCFWPIIDPDIDSYPYCRECVEETKLKTLLQTTKLDQLKETKKLKPICVQCNERSHTTWINLEEDYLVCTKPDCPNYGLLQLNPEQLRYLTKN